MPAVAPLTIVAVLTAAALHAGWNAMAKGSTDRFRLLTRMGTVGAVAAGVLLIWVPWPAVESVPWLAASVVVHVAYTLALLLAYRLGDFNQTYPLARGLGPLIVAGFAVTVIGEPLPPVAAIGVLLIGGAIAVLGLTPWGRVRSNSPAVIAAALTGAAIATYTLVDGIGVRLSDSSLGYTLWLTGLQGVITNLLIYAGRRRAAGSDEITSPRRQGWGFAAIAAVMSVAAYGLVLWAQTRGALAPVAALREASIVVAAVIGATVFKEPLGRARVAASGTVALGAVLLAVASA